MSELVVTVKPGAVGAIDAVARLRAFLDGGPSVALFGESTPHAAADGPEPDSACVILATSGSTGATRGVELHLAAVLASAEAAEQHLGGPGLWLTAMPITGAGGFNTVVRSLRHGQDPIVWPGIAGAGHFDGESLLPSIRTLRGRASAAGLRAYTSLVPTQVARLLSFSAAGDGAALEALHELARLDAVLIGADALSQDLRQTLHAYGITVVTTYGATETCGGCIYNDLPFPDTEIDFEGADPGRIVITGPTVARRYRDGAEELKDGRWLSNDLGRWRLGRLELVGRVDDLVKVGGATVALPLITKQIRALADVQELAVLARDDAEWGHVPVLFIANCDVPDATLRRFAAAALGRNSLPLDIVRLDSLPLLPNGKPDRVALLSMVH